MLPYFIVFVQRIDDHLQVLFVGQKIRIGRIHKNRFQVVLLDVVRVGFLDAEQVFVRDALLVGAAPLADVLLQPCDRRMQVNQDVRLEQLLVNDVEQALVQIEFICRQVHLGEEQTFGKKVIRDGDALKKVTLLNQLLQLLETFRHEKQFQRKGVLFRVFIELGQEGVVGKLLQDQPGIVMLRQQVRQGGLAGADVSFNSNKRILHCFNSQRATEVSQCYAASSLRIKRRMSSFKRVSLKLISKPTSARESFR